MSLAIDFASMLAEERRRARASRGGGNVADAPKAAPSSPTKQRSDLTPDDWPQYALPATPCRPFLHESHRVVCGTSGVSFIPEWCTPEEENEMLRCADCAPVAAWTTLRGRRLQSLGGEPLPPPELMSREPLPGWVQSVCDELVRVGVFSREWPPNHVLLNEYQPGQGIEAHKDGPLYAPNVAILSLSSHATFEFVADDAQRRPVASLLLPPRGLLVFTDDAYERYMHRVPAVQSDDLTRPGLVRLDQVTARADEEGDDGGASDSRGAGSDDSGGMGIAGCWYYGSSCGRAASTDAPQAPPLAGRAPSHLARRRRISLTVRRVLRGDEDGFQIRGRDGRRYSTGRGFGHLFL